MNTLQLALFAAFWLVVPCILAYWLQPKATVNWRTLLLYVVTLSALGLVGETAIDTVYTALFHTPLWEYHISPIHHGYTSLYAAFLWGAAGANIYFVRRVLVQKKVKSLHKQAVVIAVESWIFETVINITFWLLSGHYIFYYLPGDLGHFTSLQVFPLYWLVSYILIAVFDRFQKDPWFFTIISMAIGWMMAFVTV